MERGIGLVRDAVKELAGFLKVVQNVMEALGIKLYRMNEFVLIVTQFLCGQKRTSTP
jgi:hypothetical protein